MVQSIPLPIRRAWLRVPLLLLMAALVIAHPLPVSAAAPDPVLEWMKITNDTVIAEKTTPLVTGRQVALVSSAVFDAVNGIERRYEPIHVRPDVSRHASQRAAAIQAAYAILMKLYPSRAVSLTASRDASIAAISSDSGIQAGMIWGQAVADAIWTWRLTDGFNPNPAPAFLGSLGRPVPGVWRPTPLANGTDGNSGAGPQFATMTP